MIICQTNINHQDVPEPYTTIQAGNLSTVAASLYGFVPLPIHNGNYLDLYSLWSQMGSFPPKDWCKQIHLKTIKSLKILADFEREFPKIQKKHGQSI